MHPTVDISFDGTDVLLLPSLATIKGGGGCHLFEKIVAESAAKNVFIMDHTKLKGVIESIPLELSQFGLESTIQRIEKLTGYVAYYRLLG